MRRGMEPTFLLGDDKKVVAIDLSSDFCAEHEWGIERLRSSFGMPKATRDLCGLDARIIKIYNPDDFFYYEGKKNSIFVWSDNSWPDRRKSTQDAIAKGIDKGETPFSELYLSKWQKDQAVATAWSDGDFGILVNNSEHLEKIKDIKEAFEKKDIAIWLGGGQVFQNAGLVLAIVSRLPKEVWDIQKEHDIDSFNLHDAADATGIKEKLNKADKGFFALSPRWIKGFNLKDKTTKYNVIFWLNPREQQIHNYGWFTVEELEQWAKNEGPCIKTSDQKKGET